MLHLVLVFLVFTRLLTEHVSPNNFFCKRLKPTQYNRWHREKLKLPCTLVLQPSGFLPTKERLLQFVVFKDSLSKTFYVFISIEAYYTHHSATLLFLHLLITWISLYLFTHIIASFFWVLTSFPLYGSPIICLVNIDTAELLCAYISAG